MMMKKYGLITKVLLISMFAILLNGCENSLTSEFSSKANEAKFYTITGNIDVDAISAENSSRTGRPTIPEFNDINFSVSAKNNEGTNVEGTVTGTQYSITLLKGSWTITVIGEKDGVKVLEGSINVNPEDEPTTQQTITLKTIKNEGKGSLSLTITKDSGLSCGVVKATLYKTSTDITEKNLTFDTTNSTTWDVKDLNAGTYEIKLDFYQNMNSSADGTYSCENLLYSHHDTVNIFANLVTNTWTGSGYTENSFTLTKAMITSFAMSTFYVDGTNGDDSKAGTYFAPFKTLQKAVEKINGINDETSPYTIYVMNDITGTDFDFTNDNKALINVVPGENKSLNLKICGFGNEKSKINAGRNVSQTGRVMYIGKNANVTLQNLILTGGYLTDTNSAAAVYRGAGLYILNSTAEVTIKNCEISDNVIDNGYGAGLCVGHLADESLNLTIENSKISNNTIKHDSTGASSQAGAGIAIENVEANITIKDSEINSNKINQKEISNTNPGDKGVGLWLGNSAVTTISDSTISGNIIENAASTNENAGGGICIEGGKLTINGATIISGNSSGYGGGVYVGEGTEGDGTFNMAGGTISDCIAEQGGGVYVETGTFTMSGGTISGNEADCGGGIYLTGTAQLIMTGGEISGNSAYYGGGVHISGKSSKFAMEGGEISGNSAEYGGGVAVDGSFFMSGGTISGNKVTNNSNGNGSGVYVAYIGNSLSAATFEMSGGAVISLNNDVYLAKEASVTVTGNLTEENVATITPASYTEDTQVLKAGSGVTLAEQVGKFEVTPQTTTDEATINWTINANGYLELVYSDWDALKTAIDGTSTTTNSEFVITQDLTATSTITINKSVKITAESPVTITRGNTTGNTSFTDAFFKVESAGKLELGSEENKITLDGGKANDSPISATAPLITSSGTLTLTNCILQNNKNTSTSVKGGAINISAGTFTMNGGVIGKEITEKQSWEYAATDSDFSNYAYAGGGGIYVASGDVTINGGKISYNYVPNLASDCGGNAPSNTACGGGISVVKGNLTINNAEVSYNSGYQGGGIRCYNENASNDCTLTLNGTLIKGNTSNPYNGSSFGGGLMVKSFTVKFEGDTPSTIEQNYSGDGGALFLENTTSTLKNITIQNNSYNSNGYHYGSEVLLWANANVSIGSSNVTIASAEGETRGIFIYNDTNNTNNTNTLNLFGDAKLDAPVYLKSGTFVTVAGNLTEENVATITPASYTEGTHVITTPTDSSINLADQVGKFAVTPQTTTINWTIDNNGCLKK